MKIRKSLVLSGIELRLHGSASRSTVAMLGLTVPLQLTLYYRYGRYYKLETLSILSIYSESEHSVQMGLDWMPDRYAWNTNCLHKKGSRRTPKLSQVQP